MRSKIKEGNGERNSEPVVARLPITFCNSIFVSYRERRMTVLCRYCVSETVDFNNLREWNVSGGCGHQCAACANPGDLRKRGFATR